jgi:hypothetical protein
MRRGPIVPLMLSRQRLVAGVAIVGLVVFLALVVGATS